jgi:hypothetical protein
MLKSAYDCQSHRMRKHRQQRVQDFQRRATCAPDTVYHHRTGGWAYIPVHEFADNSTAPAPCVDCWCLLGSDAALLECWVSDQSSMEPGLYATADAEAPYWPKLHAILREPLTRAVVEAAMYKFVKLGFPEALPQELRPGGPLIRLAPS